jgi:quinol monooxygenase YgiN
MHEVRVIARAVTQQGKGDELKALLQGLVQPTRAEADCKYYELFESNSAGIFLFNELWESQELLDAHAASSPFREIFGRAAALLAEPLEVHLLTSVDKLPADWILFCLVCSSSPATRRRAQSSSPETLCDILKCS